MYAVPRVLALLLMLGGVTTECLFPEYLQTGSNPDKRWLYHVHNAGSLTNDANLLYVTFAGGKMEVEAQYGLRADPIPQPYRRQCLSEVQAKTYAVSHDGSDPQQPIRYACMQFTMISHNVVLVSQTVPTDWNESMCDDEIYVRTLDDWPLVSFRDAESYAANGVPAVGGFDFTMVHAQDGRQYCRADAQLPARLEIGCSTTGELSLNFGDACSPPEHMDRKQTLLSLGKWDAYDYTFFVLKSPSYPYVWCLRMPKQVTSSGHFQAHLMLDLACDPKSEISTSDNFITMNLTMTVQDGLCEDLSGHCDQLKNVSQFSCGNVMDLEICLRTCEGCTPYIESIDAGEKCDMDYQGWWLHSTDEASENVLITYHMVSLPNANPLTCIPRETTAGTMRYPMVHFSDNGCFPRLSCLEFNTWSLDVIQYRLGKPIVWPHGYQHINDAKNDICGPQSFNGKADLITNKFTKPLFQNLVMLYSRRAYVPCELDSVAEFTSLNARRRPRFIFHTLLADMSQCHGVFEVPCGEPAQNTIHVEKSDCDIWSQRTTFKCLASLDTDAHDRLVITEGVDEEHFYCWIFKSNRRDLFLLPSADCDETTRSDLEQMKVKRPGARMFDIQSADKEETWCPGYGETTEQPEVVVVTTEQNLVTDHPMENSTHSDTASASRLKSSRLILVYVQLGTVVLIFVSI